MSFAKVFMAVLPACLSTCCHALVTFLIRPTAILGNHVIQPCRRANWPTDACRGCGCHTQANFKCILSLPCSMQDLFLPPPFSPLSQRDACSQCQYRPPHPQVPRMWKTSTLPTWQNVRLM